MAPPLLPRGTGASEDRTSDGTARHVSMHESRPSGLPSSNSWSRNVELGERLSKIRIVRPFCNNSSPTRILEAMRLALGKESETLRMANRASHHKIAGGVKIGINSHSERTTGRHTGRNIIRNDINPLANGRPDTRCDVEPVVPRWPKNRSGQEFASLSSFGISRDLSQTQSQMAVPENNQLLQ